MQYDKALVAAKLRRWETYLNNYRLPAWEQIPDLGLYMEQVVAFLRQYLDYLPPELKDEEFITAAAINNYVRTKIMPEPIKKRYYRIHLAYLLVICTLKQGLSIALIRRLLPLGLSEQELREFYARYAERHALSAAFFVEQVRGVAGPILDGGAHRLVGHDRRLLPPPGREAHAPRRQGSEQRRQHRKAAFVMGLKIQGTRCKSGKNQGLIFPAFYCILSVGNLI